MRNVKQSIHELNIAQLGQLFPIQLQEHDPAWIRIACEEEMFLRFLLGDDVVRITHIGSTSVPGLLAKPTIDLLLEIDAHADVENLLNLLKEQGYEYNFNEARPAPGYMLMKGYTMQGFVGQTFHVHMRYEGDYDEVYFCEYLRRHSDVARKYAQLKEDLKKQFEHDREAYTQGKTAFIQTYTAKARKEVSKQ